MVQKQKEEEDMEEFQTNKILHENKVCVVFLISNPKLLTLKSQSCFFLKLSCSRVERYWYLNCIQKVFPPSESSKRKKSDPAKLLALDCWTKVYHKVPETKRKKNILWYDFLLIPGVLVYLKFPFSFFSDVGLTTWQQKQRSIWLEEVGTLYSTKIFTEYFTKPTKTRKDLSEACSHESSGDILCER